MICGVDVKRDESPYDLVKTLAQKNSLDRRGDWNGARALSTVQQMLAQHGWRTTTINCLPASAAVPPWEALQAKLQRAAGAGFGGSFRKSSRFIRLHWHAHYSVLLELVSGDRVRVYTCLQQRFNLEWFLDWPRGSAAWPDGAEEWSRPPLWALVALRRAQLEQQGSVALADALPLHELPPTSPRAPRPAGAQGGRGGRLPQLASARCAARRRRTSARRRRAARRSR